LAVAAIVADSPLAAQGAVAELRGRVLDASGAALPGATVTIVHTETGTARTTVSSETGAFVLPALQVGTHDIRVELSGFSTLTQEDVRLGVGESANLTFTLTLASVQENITVTGETPIVDTKQSSIAGRVDTAQVESLPLNGRNWLDLVALVPGARGNPGTVQAGASGSDMAKYNVDGVDISNQCCGSANSAYSQENIAEFQVLTNRFDAEYGRVNGAVINAVTKSGTNEFRATGFGYFRNDRFDAENPFTNAVSPFNEKQVGFNAGGPIVRDRAHFFGSYEFQDRAITSRPNTGFAQFDVDVPQDITRHYVTARADVQVSQAHRIFVRGSRYKWEQLNVDVDGDTTLSGGYSRPSDNFDVSLGDTWVISPRLLYEVRAGFSRIDNRLNSNSPTPRLNFPSATLGSPTNSPQWWKEMNTQINQSMSYFVPNLKGEHALKAGLQIFLPRFWGAFPQPAYGSYNFDSDPADFNDPSTYPAPTSYSIPLGDTSYRVSNPIYAAFVQDNWTVAPRLTFNLGLRYDLETGTTNKDREHPAEPGERHNDTDNFAPRLGFSYDLTGTGRSVLRGGYGWYYDKVMLNLTSNERRVIEGQIINVTVANPVFGDPLGGLTYEDYRARNIPADTIVIARDYRTPVNQQVSLGIAQQVGDRYGFQADVVYAKGRDEPMVVDANFLQDPDTGLPLNPRIHG
jgi:outer membrane receptor protein involved in Fe transport